MAQSYGLTTPFPLLVDVMSTMLTRKGLLSISILLFKMSQPCSMANHIYCRNTFYCMVLYDEGIVPLAVAFALQLIDQWDLMIDQQLRLLFF